VKLPGAKTEDVARSWMVRWLTLYDPATSMIGMAQEPVKMAPELKRVTALPLVCPAFRLRVMVPPAELLSTAETATRLATTFAGKPRSAKFGIPLASASGRRLEPPMPTKPRSKSWLP